MDTNVVQTIQDSLVEKQHNLTAWLEDAPVKEKQIQLCCESDIDNAIQPHLHVLESSLDKIENQALGVCQICHGTIERSLLEMDYTAEVCLGCMSQEDQHKLQVELEFSQVVHRSFLPQAIPAFPGLEIAVFSRPAQILGGDYFDFIQFQDGAQGITIADAMGHGLSASLLMTNLQAAFRTLAPLSDFPDEVLTRLNRFYLHNIHLTTFATAFLGRFEPGSLRLVYANAGHNPPMLVRGRDAQVSWLRPTGPAIGVIEEYHQQNETLELSEGDVLFFYTDGICEARDPHGEEYGGERLARLVRQNANLAAQELIWAVRQGLQAFIQDRSPEDDITLLACRVTE
jgi:serine phosphatase RsbU (regulator of sigma subunit)